MPQLIYRKELKMDKEQELLLKIINLAEERMSLLKSDNKNNSLNWEKINKRIKEI